MDDVKVTCITMPTPDGDLLNLPVISVPASAFADLRDPCTWLVPDMTGDIPMRLSAGRQFLAQGARLVIPSSAP